MPISNTTATTKTELTADFPDFPSGTVTGTLVTETAISDNNEVFPGQQYAITLDSSGNVAAATHASGFFVPCQDTAATTWLWHWQIVNSAGTVTKNLGTAYIGYNASAQALGSLLSGTTETSATYANVTTAVYTWLTTLKTVIEAISTGYLVQTDGTDLADSGILASVVALTTGATFSGTLAMADNLITRPVIEDYGETVNAIGSIGGGTQDIDLTLGNVVSGTVDTSTTTFTFSNPPASGTAGSFTLFLTNGGSQTVNWPASVDWAGGTAPTLTAAGVDILTFTTIDGGTIWYGFAAGLDMQ